MTRQYKVTEIFPLQQGTSERGEWRSREVILEDTKATEYPDRWLVRLTGDRVDQLECVRPGDRVEAEWGYIVRSYMTRDGRAMHSQEVRGWRIRKVGDASPRQ